jgi:cobalt/nickel transport system permease protein
MMAMHELMLEIESQAKKRSPIHRIDPRIMIIFTLALIIYAVLINDILKLIVLELFVLSLMALARLNPKYVIWRLLLIFPFGGFLALMQPFIREGQIINSWWVFNITQEGLNFGMLLLFKLTVCVSAVILLSSVSPLPSLLYGLKKLKVPKFFITTLNMMVRYLHLFYENLGRIRTAQRSRGFSIKNNPAGYKFVLRNLGNLISTLFIKSYDNGERVYLCMLSRGYSMDSDYIFSDDHPVRRTDFLMFVGLAVIIVFLEFHTLPIFLNVLN